MRFDEAYSGNVFISVGNDLERVQAVFLNGNRDGHEENEDM
ncbi:hypothetical protein [Parageobacillus sp. G301]|nr:hypothetical protein [Parageobacillus sp. G301]GLH63664.1 hypothetical protein PG301_15030 [Parageobacillus sp. G301]